HRQDQARHREGVVGAGCPGEVQELRLRAFPADARSVQPVRPERDPALRRRDPQGQRLAGLGVFMTFRSLSSRRQLGLAAFALAADALLPVTASAQQSPNKPIRIVVPFTPGGGNDVFARQMAKSLGELRNQGVVVENKPGAGGNLGTEYVARSAPDGTT